MHWDRIQKTGYPGPAGKTRNYNGFLTYEVAHHAVRRLWGSPSQYRCMMECGRKAVDWAYDGSDPTQFLGKNRNGGICYFSEFPEFYMPMCRACHKAMDQTGLGYGQREARIADALRGNARLTPDLQ